MAKAKGKPAQEASQAGRPAQPSWRKPPARSRRQIRERQQRSERNRSQRLRAEVTPAEPPPGHQQGNGEARRGPAARPRRDWRGPLRRALRYGFVLTLLGATIYALIQFFQLPALAVTSSGAQIGGAHRIAPRTIYDASGVEGRNIFLIRRSEVKANVQRVAGIKSASVHLRLPNQVVIDVREHAPLVAWQSGSEVIWLAADGSEVPQAGAPPPLTLTDATGAPLAQSQGRRVEVLAHLAELSASHPELREFVYGAPQGLFYRTTEGQEVWLGDSGPMAKKVTLAAAVQPQMARTGRAAQVIDLRFSDDKALWW